MVTITLFVVGLFLLIAGAEMLVRGATRLAVSLGVPPLLVGLTVVAYATGSPELAVSIQSVRAGQSEIALGNVVGSNIFNVLFILGISATILPLAVTRRLVRLEVPLMIGASGLLYALARGGMISRAEGVLLVAGSLAYTAFIVLQSRQRIGRRPPPEARAEEEAFARERSGGAGHWLAGILLIFVGLAMLVIGSGWLVDGAMEFARFLGISETVIALTIVAAGTGLPEAATSIIAGLRGERELAVGNVVGSNIFNILTVVGIAALAVPGGMAVPLQMLRFDIPVMIATAVACLPILFTGYVIARWQGIVLLSYYVAYTAFLVLEATGSVALPLYATAMAVFVLPLTAITLTVLALRELLGKRREERTRQRP